MHDGPSTRTIRQSHEAEVYDRRAAAALADLDDADLLLDPATPPFPNREHVDFLTYAIDRLGPLAGRRFLEAGCGTGSLSVWLALQGAEVVAVDVSAGELEIARRRAVVSGVADRCTFACTPIEDLAEADGSFDGVLGNQVLHHFELDAAMANISRLLAPGAKAVFCEPVLFVPRVIGQLRYSRPVLRLFPSRRDTPDERSIALADLPNVTRHFATSDMRAFQLSTRLQNFVELSDGAFVRLERLDRRVLGHVPGAYRLARYVVFVLSNAPSQEAIR